MGGDADEIARERVSALERLLVSEFKRLEDALTAQQRAVELLGNANSIAQDKFEATVRDGFVKQNEFRGSLDDLGKTMATRRELESVMEEYRRNYGEITHALGEMRSRIDIGPAALVQLQSRADLSAGRQQGVGLSANVAAFLVGTLIAAAALIVTVVIATH